MDENQNMINDSKTIAKIFNEHFSALGAKVQQKIPEVGGSFDSYLYKRSSNGKLVINSDDTTFFISPTKPKEISKLIDTLDPKNSSGPNGIPVKISFPFGCQN